MKDANMTKSNFIADKMNINLYMLSALIMNRIRGEVDDRDIVTLYERGARWRTL